MQQDPYCSIESFCTLTEHLLKEEREAEIAECRELQENISIKALEKRGVCLSKLVVDSRRTSLYGRYELTLKSSNVNKHDLPSTVISSGDIVGLHHLKEKSLIASGVVTRVTTTSISVAFEQQEELSELGDDQPLYIIKLANDVTYKRLKRTLDKMLKIKDAGVARLAEMAFGAGACSLPPGTDLESLDLYNADLDESQKEAVRLALSQKHLAIVHGPPGTGKSTTVVEVIRQLVRRGLRVLACAPSNVAVDNLVLRLAKAKVTVTRLGHPARAMHEIHRYTLDAKISESDEGRLVEDIRSDIDGALKKVKSGHGRASERGSGYAELKSLRKELKERSERAVREVLAHSDVVLSTLTSATDDGPLRALDAGHRFDVVVIDECSQAIEAACWIALIQAPKCVLAGDHLQLPPTILSHKAAAAGLAVTLMERLIPRYPVSVQMLTVQYRMNELIMKWASEELYEGKLTAHQSVARHLLCQLPGVEDNEITREPLLFIDTSGCDLPELDLPDEQSKGNEGEADLVAIHTEFLIQSGIRPADIAVISPYNLQVELIRSRLSEKYGDLEVKSVDGYQGREKEAVIISLVRSNNRGVVGFLSEDRRLNVAITRARRQVIVIGDSDTISKHAFLGRLVSYLTEHGVVRSAAEYQQEHEVGALSERVVELMKKREDEREPAARPAKSKNPRPKPAHKRHDPPAKTNTSHHGNANSREKRSSENSEDREERIRQEMTTLVTQFLDGSEQERQLSASLSSYERMLIHQLAESYGLSHQSVGEGAGRCIILRRPPAREAIKAEASAASPPANDSQPSARPASTAETSETGTPTVDRDSPSSVSKAEAGAAEAEAGAAEAEDGRPAAAPERCEACGKAVPSVNLPLHQLRCAAAGRVSGSPTSTEQQNGARNKSQRVKQKPQKEKARRKEVVDTGDVFSRVDGDDFDALLAAADQLNSVCNMKKCKTLVKTLGTTCPHCNQRFCIGHGMPEAHGCSDAARAQARAANSRDAGRLSGNGSKKSSSTTRARLENKLNKKLSDLGDQRRPKSHK